jgi:hypothetical protein
MIKCEQPNPNLTKFKGNFYYNDQEVPIDVNQLLLRGTVLKMTNFVFGVVIYAGADVNLFNNKRLN